MTSTSGSTPPAEGPLPVRRVSLGIQIAETVLMVTAVALGGLAIPNSWGLLEANPHPLWLVILAIAGRYGAPTGYIAGVLSALVYAAFLWTAAERPDPSQGTTELMPAFFMLLAGALLSELTTSRQRTLAAQQQVAAAATERAGALEAELVATTAVVDELKRRVLHNQQTLPSLAEVGKRLQTLDAAAVRHGLPALVVRVLDIPECSVYRLTPKGLVGEHRWPSSAAALPPLRRENAVIARVIAAKQALSVRSLLDDATATTLDGQPVLLAGPLLDAAEEVDSVVVVTRLPATRLNEQTVAEFQALLEWASLALRNCQLHEVTRGMGGGGTPTGTPPASGRRRRAAETADARMGAEDSAEADSDVTPGAPLW